jgi:hypothetical protein
MNILSAQSCLIFTRAGSCGSYFFRHKVFE